MLGVVLASLAAVAFGTGTYLQYISALSVEPTKDHERPPLGLIGLLASLVRSPRWLVGQALAGSGTAMQFSALAFAPVAVVEPIVGTGLPVALVLEAVRERRRPGWRLLVGLLMCVSGLVVFLLFSRASAPRHDPGVVTATLLLCLGAGLALVSRLAPAGRIGSVVAGAASGGCLGVAVVAVSVPIARFQRDGLVDTLTDWSPYVALITGLMATAATQQAYTRGDLAWSLPPLTVADPLLATILSVVLLREQLDASATPIWAAGAAVACLGVALSAVSRGVSAVPAAPSAPVRDHAV